jgi:hypothetical protein
LTPGTTEREINNAPIAYSEVATANTGVTSGHIMQNVVMGADGDLGNGRIVIMWKVGAGGTLNYGCDANRNSTMNEIAVYDTLELSNGKTTIRYVSIDGQDIPMHFCSPYMLAAYAGFSGLRPMTELEYEKACRGPLDAKPNEYAWGSGTGVAGDYIIGGTAHTSGWRKTANQFDLELFGANYSAYKNINRGDERLSVAGSPFGTGGMLHTPDANYYWWHCVGSSGLQAQLLRVGAFADTNTNRQSSGASYWGIMNLSDNAYEYTVLATTPSAGLVYNGEHGNGVLVLDPNGVYPDGVNAWRLPTNGANWWAIRGIYLYYNRGVGYNRSGGWWECGVPSMSLQPNGILSNKATGMVGYRSLGVYSSQKNTAMFAGIRCVRTVSATK